MRAIQFLINLILNFKRSASLGQFIIFIIFLILMMVIGIFSLIKVVIPFTYIAL